MSEARVNAWTEQIAKPRITHVPKLASLPPTTGAFSENVKEDFFFFFLQTFKIGRMHWNCSLRNWNLLIMVLRDVYVWKSLQPPTVSVDTPLAPSNIKNDQV